MSALSLLKGGLLDKIEIDCLIKSPLPLRERVRERGHPPLSPPIEGGETKAGGKR